MKKDYLKFEEFEETITWFYNNYKDFLYNIQKNSNIDGTLGNAIFCYTGSMSKDYNNILRFNNGNLIAIDEIIDKYYGCESIECLEESLNYIFAQDAKTNIKLMYDAFSLNKMNDNVILFHYFNINCYGKELLKKNTFEINNFISTTLIRNSFGIKKLINANSYNSLLVIKVKKGTSCIPVANNPNSCLKEYEIILKPKSQFKINKLGHNWFDKIKYVIECELI